MAELADALRRASEARQTVFRGVGLLKQAIKPPKPLKGSDDWERFVWQAETYLSLIDETFPGHLDEARKQKTSVDASLETQEHRILSVKLFGLLVGWVHALQQPRLQEAFNSKPVRF